MKVALVLISRHHGNTRRVAEVLAAELAAEILSPATADERDLSEYQVLGLGSGIYYGRHATEILQLAETAPRLPTRAFLFSTAGSPLFWKWYHRALRQRLLRRGVEVIGEFNCAGWDTFGPLAWIGGLFRSRPNRRDLERAGEFARQLALRVGSNPMPVRK